MTKTMSDQVRDAIDASGLSRYRIAKEADVPESSLSRFMAGEGIGSETLDRIAELLRLELRMRGPRADLLRKHRR